MVSTLLRDPRAFGSLKMRRDPGLMQSLTIIKLTRVVTHIRA